MPHPLKELDDMLLEALDGNDGEPVMLALRPRLAMSVRGAVARHDADVRKWWGWSQEWAVEQGKFFDAVREMRRFLHDNPDVQDRALRDAVTAVTDWEQEFIGLCLSSRDDPRADEAKAWAGFMALVLGYPPFMEGP